MDTLATELRAAAVAIERTAHESRCWSVISETVNTCTSHIAAIAGNVEKNQRIHELEAGRGGTPYNDPLAIIDRVTMGPTERRIAVALALRFGLWTTTNQLIDAAYSGRPDGGPTDATGAIAVTITHLRRKLAPERLTIQGVPYSGRRMVRI